MTTSLRHDRVRKIWAQSRRRARNVVRRTRQRVHDTFLSSYLTRPSDSGELARLVSAPDAIEYSECDAQAVRLFCGHRFDLLGSGWVQVRYGMSCDGFEEHRFAPLSDNLDAAGRVNAANARGARAIRELLSPQYDPIDWQIDFKSGYRWSERTWYRDLKYGTREGVDVKLPWELSRMQHLPQLAVAFAATKNAALVAEFSDQILDWIAANPPRFGVNWGCTMDVGIRIANWLLAFDVLRASGARFNATFVAILANSVHDHANHIVQNLEWSETHRGNHYLGNIAGLLFAAAYLPSSPPADAWLAFAIQELCSEAERQFLLDGGHFEASTSYHCLCAEMLAVSAVLIRSLPLARIQCLLLASRRSMRYGPGLAAATADELRRRFDASGMLLPPRFFETLARASRFVRSHVRTDGSLVQIGDNDSGRFIRIGGWQDAGTVAECRSRFANLSNFSALPDDHRYPMQSQSAHLQFLAWTSVLFDEKAASSAERASTAPVLSVAHAFVAADAKRPALEEYGVDRAAMPAPRRHDDTLITHRQVGVHHASGSDLLSNVHYERYPSFGTYIVRSDRMLLAIRCGFARHDGEGGHAHNDQLAIDMTIDGERVAQDPGTYVYTPSRRWRNRYRRANAHCAPAIDRTVESGEPGVFAPAADVQSECLSFGPEGFRGRMLTGDGSVTRSITWHTDRVQIVDEYALPAGARPASPDPFTPADPVTLSPGYGVRLR
jgi:hypothetical protein